MNNINLIQHPRNIILKKEPSFLQLKFKKNKIWLTFFLKIIIFKLKFITKLKTQRYRNLKILKSSDAQSINCHEKRLNHL